MKKIIEKISEIYNKTIKSKKMSTIIENHNVEMYVDKDYMLLSKNVTCKRVNGLLEDHRPVICNLTDRNGKIGQVIVDIAIEVGTNKCYVEVIDGNKYYLYDRYLYNIIYKMDNDKYSLEEHDEYYEKIEAIK